MESPAMPKELEEKLKRQAKSKHLKGDRADAYVYGTMRKTGWTPATQKKKSTSRKKKHLWREE